MGTITASCPRCGQSMQRRLDELECSGCGYFVSARESSGTVSRHLLRDSSAPLPGMVEQPQRPASLPVFDPRRRELLYLHRRIYLVAFLLLFFGVNALALKKGIGATAEASSYSMLAIATVVFAGLCAAVMYIDWRLVKQITLGLLAVAAGLYAWEFVLSAPGDIWRDIAAGTGILLAVWLAGVLVFDLLVEQ